MKKDVFLTPPLYLPVLFTFRVTVVIAVGVALAINCVGTTSTGAVASGCPLFTFALSSPSTINATTTTVTIATSTQAPAAPTVSSTVRHHKTFLCLFFKFNVLHNKVKIKNPQPQCVPHRTKPAANILITNKTICRRRLDIAYY